MYLLSGSFFPLFGFRLRGPDGVRSWGFAIFRFCWYGNMEEHGGLVIQVLRELVFSDGVGIYLGLEIW